MTASHLEMLRSECNEANDREGACQLLCGQSLLDADPWDSDSQINLTVHKIEPISDGFMRREKRSVSWDMDCYIKLLRKAREQNLHPGICHNHPNSSLSFSLQDDKNEAHLRDLLQRRNRNENQFLTSILLRGDGEIEARVWFSTGPPEATSIRILGNKISEHNPNVRHSDYDVDTAFLHRQALCIGQETVDYLKNLRIAVVGCGGTGSAVSILLARIGVGRLLLIDPDIVSETNLNRLHGSTRLDAEHKRSKVSVLKDHIVQMGLGTNVIKRNARLADSEIARLLRSCDVVFGCTDDHHGRIILNRFAYFYLVPVIDTGLSVDPSLNNGKANISGRVTVLRPGATCLICRGVINPQVAREQSLRYQMPSVYRRQIKEGYISDSDIPTPVIGTFTTETAAAAVNELLAGVSELRGKRGWNSERTIRYDLDRVRPTGCDPRPQCPICDDETYWGLGDIQPFLDVAAP